jgi:hypothetical protein
MAHIALPRFVIAFGLTGVIVAIIRSKRHMQSAKPHALLDYFLLWPLILDQRARRERVAAGGRFLTTGEIVGTALFVVVLMVGLTLF